ncbi:MAG: response regulator [Candidatus Aminicenantes bacterium]|jgi:signal transduction histidine kinase/CheY-like chemotaxis protein/AraC-like DNA-binding protein
MQKKIHKPPLSMKFIFIWGILLAGLLFVVARNLYSQETGYKYFKNYDCNEDYKHNPQNWGMAQDKDGIIYVANNAGVLIFDGVSWRPLGIPDFAVVRSLAIDESGTLYIGGKGEIGYFTKDEKGALKYKSLMSHLKEEQRNFDDVWRTVATNDGIYFNSYKFLFRWDPKAKQMKVWNRSKPTYYFIYSFEIIGKLFIHQHNTGLMQMIDDSLDLIPGGDIFAEASGIIFMMVPYDTGHDPHTLLIGTRKKGFFLYDGTKVNPFPTGVDDYLQKNIASHGIRLSCGDFALATRQGGIVIMDSNGGLKNIFDKASGLQDEYVNYILEDNQGNLWLCLENGITKIEYSSPFSIYDNRCGLFGIVLSVMHHGSGLYVGTTKGLYVLPLGAETFKPVPVPSSYYWCLLSIGDSIMTAAHNGVFLVDGKNNLPHNIIKSETFTLLPCKRFPGRIWCGTSGGLVALAQKKSRWVEERRFKSIHQSIQWIAEEGNGSLWLVTSKGGILKVEFPIDNADPVVTPYNTGRDMIGARVVTEAAGHVMFATDKGLFRFDEKKKKFIPDKTLGDEFAGGDNSLPVFRLVEDKDKTIWFHSKSRNYQAIPGPEGLYKICRNPFRRIPKVQGNTIYPAPDGKNIWFGSIQGLIRYDTTVKKSYKQDFHTLVRKVLANEKLIFDGHKNKTSKKYNGLFPIFEYKNRNFHFEFAAPYFEAETETQYQYFLEGYDNVWSTWNKDVKRNYTNLDSGMYTFRVRALNVYQHQSSEDAFQFKVLPPWYKTWWAFILYFIFLAFLMFLVVKWRSYRLLHEKKRLELIVQQRTKEIEEKNIKLEDQTVQLKDQSDKLKEMDQLKSRFFANISHEFRTPLTLIMSPLEQMIVDSRDKEQKNKFKVMRRSSQRLLTLINQLLDLSRFDSGKMKLQASCENIVPFLKGTVASFHLVAVENQLELVFHPEKEEISLYFDAQKMEEVMYNLLINAIKFTPNGGKITVSITVGKDRQEPVKEELDFVYISIRDTGPGISQEQLAHIFDRFYQAEGLKERSHKGAGIGLALTKEIVLLHHGKIDVHSREGQGTEFVIQLPMGRDHLKPGEIVSTAEDVSGKGKCKEIETLHVTEKLEEDQDNQDTGEIEPVSKVEIDVEETKMPRQEKDIILVVEDEPDVRKFIRSPLEPFYKVVEAKDGKEGIHKAKEIIPDMIVSDIMMPGTDGYELCRVLKKDINTSHIPVVLLTAKASEESIIQGLETGADDYITKPFNTKMLLNRIKNLIELRRQLQLKIQRKKMLLPSEISVSSPDEKFLKEFQGIIEKNLSDPDFGVDELSQKLIMGRSTLYRKIQALTGETPNQFILSYRLERGAQLLREQCGNVTEVAFEVGFSSAAYFSKLFKEKFHQTPSEFQASQSPGEKV